MIEIIGYWFAIICAFASLAALSALVAYLNVVASKYFLQMLGGWKVLHEFSKWKREKAHHE